MMGQVLKLLLSNNGIEFSHTDMLRPLHCLSYLMLVLLRQKWDDLSANSSKPLHNLCLFLHLNVQSIRHLVVHDGVPLHLCLLTRQLLILHLQAVVLRLEELELLFDAIQRLKHSKLSVLPRQQRSLWSTVGVHGPCWEGGPLSRASCRWPLFRGPKERDSPAILQNTARFSSSLSPFALSFFFSQNQISQ